ncbi:MAG: hypothetical protein RLZ71_45 [Actinomycetota bacterium]|jgi:predicted DCC family thiol-disulfide oxidoreductase YuxK
MSTPVLIFDGDCGFCTSTANYIVKHSKTPVIAHPWQLIDVTVYGILEPQAAERVYIYSEGRAFAGHEAFAELLRLQRNPILSVIAFLMVVPPLCWLARIGYSLVARYRHKLPGGTPACKIAPREETKHV